jgi:hypothetical protein
MKIVVLATLMCVGFVAASDAALGMEAVTTCALDSNRGHTLSLLRDHPIGTTAVYYISKDGTAPARIYSGEEDQSRGDEVQVACVGSSERALVISGEFASNYLQGIAIRYNTRAKRWERIDFAERTRPASVYLDVKGIAVLIPNAGRNESPERYIIYRYDARTGKAEQTYSDRLPRSRGTRIPERQERSGK